jgi:hypothetical protein
MAEAKCTTEPAVICLMEGGEQDGEDLAQKLPQAF